MTQTNRRIAKWVAAAAVIVSQTSALAQQTAPGQSVKPNHGTAANLAYITADSAVAVIAHPRRVLMAPELQMLPIEIFSAMGKKEMGLDPLDVETVVALVEPPKMGPPGGGVVVSFAKPFDWKSLPEQLLSRSEEGQLQGREYRRGRGPMDPSIIMVDQRTLIVATDQILRRMLAAKSAPTDSAVPQMLSEATDSYDLHAVLSVDMVRELILAQLKDAPSLPGPFDRLMNKAIEGTVAVELRVSVTGQAKSGLVLHTRDVGMAKELERLIDEAITAGREMLLAQIAQERQSDDPIEEAALQYARRAMGLMFDQLRPVRQDDQLIVSSDGGLQGQVATTGVLTALLLPAVQAAREAARRTQSMNQMRQLGIAILNHESDNGKLPARASFSADGKPLLSWRVHVLPYLEQRVLYEQFHLDEPWDSEHNKKLIEAMPNTYKNPNRPSDGKTTYLVPAGKGTMFEGRNGLRVREIVDGTSRTIMLVEADEDRAVIWTKPEDLQYNAQKPLAGLGHTRTGGFLALMADVSIHFVSNSVDQGRLRAWFTCRGKEPVDTP